MICCQDTNFCRYRDIISNNYASSVIKTAFLIDNAVLPHAKIAWCIKPSLHEYKTVEADVEMQTTPIIKQSEEVRWYPRHYAVGNKKKSIKLQTTEEVYQRKLGSISK